MRYPGLLPFALVFAFSHVATSAVLKKRIEFRSRQSATEITGAIKGNTIVDYSLGGRAGQHVVIDFRPSNLSAYFNLLSGDGDAAIHVGSLKGNHFEGVLPDDGDYRIRVYLMRSAARRNETSRYKLTVSISGSGHSGADATNSDFADGMSGGPDFWSVSGVAEADLLNVHAEAGTESKVVGKLTNGDVIRNLGCKMIGQSRWCRIQGNTEKKFMGWVNGRYLREAAQP